MAAKSHEAEVLFAHVHIDVLFRACRLTKFIGFHSVIVESIKERILMLNGFRTPTRFVPLFIFLIARRTSFIYSW